MIRLIDTDILIDHLKGKTAARDFLVSSLGAGDRLLCSVITHAELLSGMRPHEEHETRALLATLVAVPVDESIAEVAGAYRRSFFKSHNMLLPDALIAATANFWRATLTSTNIQHFPMTDIALERPY